MGALTVEWIDSVSAGFTPESGDEQASKPLEAATIGDGLSC